LTFDDPYFTNTINGKKITVFPNLVSLITKTGCKTPIVDHRWLQVTLNGTKYYSARGISKSSDPKQTDFEIPNLNPEDPIVGALKVGLSISRLEFEQIFPDLLERSYE